MKKFIIITDSCADLDKEKRERYDIEYLPMRVLYDDHDIPASLDWKYISYKAFYELMRNGKRFKTAQVNASEYKETFEKYIKEGYDILSISCSSALSSSFHASEVVRDELKAKYPEAKIYCVDSRNSSLGLGIICMTASKLRANGVDIEDTYNYIENHKQEVNQLVTVESLSYLKRAGRVSTMSAVFGGMLQVKPIIISDINGQNTAVEKVKGRKNSFARIVQMFNERYQENENQMICVVNSDCEEDAKTLRDMILEANKDKNLEITIEKIGPIVGASTGPGTVGVFFFGKPETFDSNKK